MLVERLGQREVHETETPRVVIGDDPVVIEDENDVIVLRYLLNARDGTCRALKPRSSPCGMNPDMPKCAIRVSPLSRSNRRYLARRDVEDASAGEPFRERLGNGKRMSARRNST